nr:immunoglobulin light chain junction region [Macaca mulatta]MOW74358.1 immunoglobulin light chain junction region [Macaca mulatta]
CQKYIRSPLTF